MKIGILMNVYNEIEWVELAIQSIENHFEDIVIVEGSYQITIEAGASPRSNDGTLEVLERYKDKPNITVIHENEPDACNQLNKGLKILKSKGVDWAFFVDGDEVWLEKDLKIIKNYINIGEKNGIYQYWINFYNFTNSFDRYMNGRLKRAFKLTPECRFIRKNENMEWPDHGKPVDIGTPAPHISEIPKICRGFHYTAIKSKNRWLLKREYLKNRDNNPIFDKWHVNKNGIVHELIDQLKPYTKKHPPSVMQHELYKLWEKDVSLFKKKLYGTINTEYEKYLEDQSGNFLTEEKYMAERIEETYKYFDLLCTDLLKDVDFRNLQILDVGCREFFTFDYFLEKYENKIIGIDVGKRGITYCKEKGKPCIEMDAHTMDEHLEHDKFNLISAIHSFEHMYDLKKVLRNCNILLKNEGYLYFGLPMPSRNERRGHWYDVPSEEFMIKLCEEMGFERIYSKVYPARVLKNEVEMVGLFKKIGVVE